MSRRAPLAWTISIAVAVALFGAACASSAGNDPLAGPPGDAGVKTAPPASGEGKKDRGKQGDSGHDFSVETFDGDTFVLSRYRGMPVVLNFWESW